MLFLPDVSKPIRHLVVFLLSLLLVSIIGLIALASLNLMEEHTFGREIGKTLLQVIAVSVIGTTVSLLLAEFNRAQEALQKDQDRKREAEQQQIELQRRLNENKDQFRKEILRKANEIYADTKKARRLLRARAFVTPFYGVWDGNTPILLEVYDRYMEILNDSQLELEILAKEIETNGQAFSCYQELTGFIKPMEEHLGQIVTEFEQHRADFKGTPASLPIGQLTEMQAMLGPSRGKPFEINFVINHKNLIASIRRDLFTSPKL
jgi:hypothetical protein